MGLAGKETWERPSGGGTFWQEQLEARLDVCQGIPHLFRTMGSIGSLLGRSNRRLYKSIHTIRNIILVATTVMGVLWTFGTFIPAADLAMRDDISTAPLLFLLVRFRAALNARGAN